MRLLKFLFIALLCATNCYSECTFSIIDNKILKIIYKDAFRSQISSLNLDKYFNSNWEKDCSYTIKLVKENQINVYRCKDMLEVNCETGKMIAMYSD